MKAISVCYIFFISLIMIASSQMVAFPPHSYFMLLTKGVKAALI